AALGPATTYTVTIRGVRDFAGITLPTTAISFTTGGDSQGGSGDGEETSNPTDAWRSMPPLRAAPGETALSGQALQLNGRPLAGVTLSIDERSAQTDRSGRFLLAGL